jgi:hypothetical protein
MKALVLPNPRLGDDAGEPGVVAVLEEKLGAGL